MTKNILQMLEKSASLYPEKTAFSGKEREISYSCLVTESRTVGSCFSEKGLKNRPIAVFIDKSVNCLTAMFGIVYSGNFYVILDTAMPKDRIETIFETLSPCAVITDEKNIKKAEKLGFSCQVYVLEEMLKGDIDNEYLDSVRRRMIDTDPVYALFTSGSTGRPKGTVVCHRSVIDYAYWVCSTFGITNETVFGSQTPFYFSMSVLDIYSALYSGASFHIIPKMFFSFPIKLLEFLNEKKINTIYWVPSALSIVANLKALDETELPYLKKVLFAGEVMPVKPLNEWINHLGNDVLFANLYGPTEVTDICTYYIVNRHFENDESLPIGTACDNCGVVIIKEDGTEAGEGEQGELCVRGSFLAMGYFNDPEKTAKAFTQNPLNPYYPELIYHTGDIVKLNEYGEIIYLCRNDYQIKHMGYRIELGEIETAVNAIDNITACACVYDNPRQEIVLFYEGKSLESKELLSLIKKKVPVYMCPNRIVKLDRMPHNMNGKIDRTKLKELAAE